MARIIGIATALALLAAAPQVRAAEESAPAASQPEALMVVRFKPDQHYSYFERPLRKAVGAAEAQGSGNVYEVISYVPAQKGGTPSAIARRNAKSEERLQSVMEEMTRNGVDPSRIRFRTEQAKSGDAQEIKIFVNPEE